MHLDDNNTRVGFGVAPSVRAHFRAANNDGLRLDNSSNSNRIGVQILNVSSQGQLLLYNSSESNRATLNGDGTSAFSTTGTATVDASAVMTLDSTTLGLLPPRMTTTQQNAISSPTKGLVIYNTSTDKLMVYTGSWTVIGTQT
jgi:hypothetical protein